MIEPKLERMVLAIPMSALGAKETISVECPDGTSFQPTIRPTDPILFAFARWNTHPRIAVGFPIPTTATEDQVMRAVEAQLKAEFKRRELDWPGGEE